MFSFFRNVRRLLSRKERAKCFFLIANEMLPSSLYCVYLHHLYLQSMLSVKYILKLQALATTNQEPGTKSLANSSPVSQKRYTKYCLIINAVQKCTFILELSNV